MNSFVGWFTSEFSKSNILSGVLAIAIWGAIIFLAVSQAPIPEILYYAGSTIIGFFFGAKLGQDAGVRQTLTHMAEQGQAQ